MNKKTLIALSATGIVIGCLSGAFSYLFFKIITIEAVVAPIVLLLLGVSFSFLKEDKKKVSLIIFVSSLVIYLVARGYISIIVHRAEGKDVALYMALSLIPFFLFAHFYFDIKKNRSLYVVIAVACSLIFSKLLLEYTVRYIYLYEWTYDFSASKSAILAGSISLFIAVISKLIFDTKRNYLSYFCIILAGIIYGVENAIRLDSSSDLLGIIKGIVSCQMFWWMIFSFIIFFFLETKKEKEYERRNIIFKDIVYQELKPIKKRKRIVTFEVPPNVPKFKHDLTLEKESEGINNRQND